MQEPIKLYGAALCPQCQAARSYLKHKKVSFTCIDVYNDTQAMKLLESKNITTLPVVMRGTKYVVGFNVKEIDKLLKEEM